ncbi:MAG: TetR/AcrR family transcriptional regulator [Candidatus Manganitrophaceae bacterium]|nr:MAG: TetR/AcrR family transcriptional regulator [Candidatus Manganitrophaceae bacterium]
MNTLKQKNSNKDTREAILDSAESIIQTYGANGISYQTISDIVQIRKASIHYHFPTKEKLIEELVRRYRLRFLALVDAFIDSPLSAPTKLERYIALFEQTLEDKSGMKVCLCGMLGAELASMGSPTVKILRNFYSDNIERLARILEEGREAGSLKFSGDAEALGGLIFSLLEGAMIIARAADGMDQFRSIRKQLLKIIKV